MNDMSQQEIKDHYELYNRLQNDHRKKMLAFIYGQPRSYTELIEHTGLKPGSLYHHLNLLKPLIEKEAHGLYIITELGKTIAEEFDLVSSIKPEIVTTDAPPDPKTETREISKKSEVIKIDDLLTRIWNSWTTYIFILFVLSMTILLGLEGIALAGSAIYATNSIVAFYFDLTAFFFGWLVLYSLEVFVYHYQIYERVRYTMTIRFISMLPASVIGLALWLLFQGGIIPDPSVYPFIFAMTITLGTWLAASGISYLRGFALEHALQWSVAVCGIDLLFGIIVLISY